MKVVVIGCTHAGTAAVKSMLNHNKDIEVNVYERNDNVSFLSCGIALYVGGIVKDVNGLFYSSPEELRQLGANVFMEYNVEAIDYDKKTVTVKNLTTNEISVDSFDKLVLSTGSWPIIPRIPGISSSNVLLSKNFNQANEIIEQAKHAQKIVVVGAGYIGVELAEAFELLGKEVVLIDGEERIMPKYLDEEFTYHAQKAFTDNGVKLALGEKVDSFITSNDLVTHIKTNKATYETDLVIMCIGFKPNDTLYKGILETTPNGALITNEYMQTSNPDVFACGDNANIIYNPTDEVRYIPLATNAVRMGTLVGLNIVDQHVPYVGTQGTSGIKIYDLNISSTGLTEGVAQQAGIEYETITIHDHNRPEFMPSYDDVLLKLVYEKHTKRLLGGQILSKYDLTAQMNILSLAIQNKMTIEQLAFADFFFQPHYSKPWNLLNTAALAALNKN
ncbi:FAD-dependent oxidoreductase [Acholeplasma laidlawii]|uniref:CoA-disulfide reductase n=2 Tax=Acholeplasma laidlawii TaxID=2148 RepID=A9NH15_ACHLI|nr:FAD-dependent oxidoreductase [Acholeplasma laidlawii]ABX81645.1 CoA-disulfide reductase [Acholeplasma laidlawii PG-8A]NWH09779.1 FAD-dependent oxidoreductase [Acholeplasma laidlawii]NWH11169.1 FAD-dependent oxidoreductase [Acholeplasma laidlawii]NWH13420.1 FAD-dependent oxidoreductase [Acholeplasma laidlawii]NWH14031.1 FAD-dependent oxidoreductase [Acholeplasma laidlawii]